MWVGKAVLTAAKGGGGREGKRRGKGTVRKGGDREGRGKG